MPLYCTPPQHQHHLVALSPLPPSLPSPGGQSVRLSICGLELPPSLARRGLEGTMGWNGTYDEEQRVAAALGAMSHVVERLAWVLGIPLRYPLVPQVSLGGG